MTHFNGYITSLTWTPKGTSPMYQTFPNRALICTDKGKSIYNLAYGAYENIFGKNGFTNVPSVNEVKFIPSEEPDFPMFARPCPKKPRHGFVDSKVVRTPHALLNLYRETLVNDPGGEIVMMKPYSAAISAVGTNNGVTWGRGNDGATMGKNTVTIEAPSKMNNVKEWLDRGGCYDGVALEFSDCPYFEVVEHERDSICVQVRDGPTLPQCRDYIPKDTMVANIYHLDLDYSAPDLLKWNGILLKEKYNHPEGTVLFFPGGSLSSHYAIHAIQLGIPVYCGNVRPTIGTYLKETENKVESLTFDDEAIIQKWMAYWSRTPLSTYYGDIAKLKKREKGNKRASRYAIMTAIAILHSCATWDNRPLYLALRAFAAVTVAKFVVAACIGENRHYNILGPGDTRGITQEFNMNVLKACQHSIGKRSEIYAEVLDTSLEPMSKWATQCSVDFLKRGWGDDQDSYGGENWSNCANLANGLIRVINNARPWANVLFELNRTTNAVHNGGNVLTKWLQDTQLDLLAEAPALGFLNLFAGKLALDWTNEENIK